MNLELISLIAKDNEIIPYRKELNSITGGITSTILLQQIIYWYVKNNNKPFYKFIEPCSHEKYNDGDSWCEELGFTRKEFATAIKKLEERNLVSKKTNMSRLTYYKLNLGDLDKALKGIYVNAKKGFTKSPKGDLDNKDTETTAENNTENRKNTKKENPTSHENQEPKRDGEKISPKQILDFYKENISSLRAKIQEASSFNAMALNKKDLGLILTGLRNYAKALPQEQYITSLQNFIKNRIYLDYQEEPVLKTQTRKRNANKDYQSKRQNFDDLVDEVLGTQEQEQYAQQNDHQVIEGEIL